MKIWKYQIGTEDITDNTIGLGMPKGAEIVHVQAQRDIPCIWALVDPFAELKMRYFYIAATGQDVPDGRYVGTVFQMNGSYVWHIFEVWTQREYGP